MQTTKNRKFPLGNSLLYISLLSVAFGRVRPIQGRTLFFILSSIFYSMTPSHIPQKNVGRFSEKQTSPKKPSQGSFGEAVKKEEK